MIGGCGGGCGGGSGGGGGGGGGGDGGGDDGGYMLTVRGRRSWPTDRSREGRVKEEGVWRAWQKRKALSVLPRLVPAAATASAHSLSFDLSGRHGASLVATGLCCRLALHRRFA